MGKTHPITLCAVMNIAIVYHTGLKDRGKAEEIYERALVEKEAQFGNDNIDTMRCAENYRNCLKARAETVQAGGAQDVAS